MWWHRLCVGAAPKRQRSRCECGHNRHDPAVRASVRRSEQRVVRRPARMSAGPGCGMRRNAPVNRAKEVACQIEPAPFAPAHCTQYLAMDGNEERWAGLAYLPSATWRLTRFRETELSRPSG